MFFFIADTHFGHGAIIDLCHRPFKCLEEMDSFMIGRWNEKVSHNDTVYVAGDLFYKHEDPEKTLKQLKGKKRLITGGRIRKARDIIYMLLHLKNCEKKKN